MKENKKIELFNNILDEHRLILHKVSRAYCPDEDDRKDLIQEIRVQIWRSIEKYNDEFKMSTWIYRIALNVAISHFRKTSRQKTVPISSDAQNLEEHNSSEHEEKLFLLEQFINELNELDKALFSFTLKIKVIAK